MFYNNLHITENSLHPHMIGLQAIFIITGVEGIEPSSGVLETLILPMNYTPIQFYLNEYPVLTENNKLI